MTSPRTLLASSLLVLCACGVRGLTEESLHPTPDAGTAPTASLTGFVYDSLFESALVGAQVFVGNRETKTDEEGLFTVDGLQPGLQRVDVLFPEYWDGIYFFTVETGAQRADFAMERMCDALTCPSGFFCEVTVCRKSEGPASLTVTVTDFCGQGVAAAKVVLADNRAACTDAQGRVSFSGLFAGESAPFRVSHDGYESFDWFTKLKPGGNTEPITLSRVGGCDAPRPAVGTCTP